VALAAALDLTVTHPAVQASRLWTRGTLRPLPRSLMGVPTDVAALAGSGVLSTAGLERVRAEASLPGTALGTALDDDEDVSVGDLVADRLGDEVTDRLVEPLLGGVYAGRAREISARAAVPQLVALAARGSLLEAAAALPATTGPVFAGLPGGMAGLTDALAAGLDVRTSTTVRGVRSGATGQGGPTYVVETGPTTDVALLEADAVVLATPAAATARLLGELAPVAAAALAEVEHASLAIVTLAFRAGDLPELGGAGSGFLVPPVDGRSIKAATISSAKWGWVRDAGRRGGDPADDVVLLRTSLGRHREETVLQRDDDELVALSLADLADAVGIGATPVDTHVQRWGGALPQYAVGHLARVARVRADVARRPGLAVCGAAYDGVGIPAVIASAHAAALKITQEARQPTPGD
jgi:oxygen-dependent protoporphyrinogen oxidase